MSVCVYECVCACVCVCVCVRALCVREIQRASALLTINERGFIDNESCERAREVSLTINESSFIDNQKC